MGGQKQSYVIELINRHIYQSNEAEWSELMVALVNKGFTSKEVYGIMNTVREEGVA